MKNKTKAWKRDDARKALLKHFHPDTFCETTEAFDGGEGGLWMSNEVPYDFLEGNTLFDYNYTPHPKLQAILDEIHWFLEPYDEGTAMLYPN